MSLTKNWTCTLATSGSNIDESPTHQGFSLLFLSPSRQIAERNLNLANHFFPNLLQLINHTNISALCNLNYWQHRKTIHKKLLLEGVRLTESGFSENNSMPLPSWYKARSTSLLTWILTWNLMGKQHEQMHEIGSSHLSYLLGNYAIYFDKWISTFWKNMLPPSSIQNIQW